MMPTFVALLDDDINQAMLNLYNDYKQGRDVDDCWNIEEENTSDHGPYYNEHPIKMSDCPIFESADHNINMIDAISSFCVIESPSNCIWFDRCKENKYWSKSFKVDGRFYKFRLK